MNQSVIDTCASVFTVIMSVVILETTGLFRDSIYDQFVCRFWLNKKPLWCTMVLSTYGILLTTLSRYFAVIYPIQYKTVRTVYCEMHISCLLRFKFVALCKIYK